MIRLIDSLSISAIECEAYSHVILFFCFLQHIPNGWPKEVLSDVENLPEEKIDDILNEFLKDF